MTERQIENDILNYLQYHNIYAWKNENQGTFDPTKKLFRKKVSKHKPNGVADIIGVLPDGKFLAIEVKTEAVKKRILNNIDKYIEQYSKSKTVKRYVDQYNFLDFINYNNGIGFFASSISDLKERLSSYL